RFFCHGAQAIVASPCCDRGQALAPDSVEPSTCCVSASGELLIDEAKPVAPSPEPLPPALLVGTTPALPASHRISAAPTMPPRPTGPPILLRTQALLI